MILGEESYAKVPRPRGWTSVANFGFCENKEVADVACSLLSLLSLSYEWRAQSPVSVFEGDIYSAFDFLQCELIVEAMQFARWPPNVIAAVHSQNIDLHVETSFFSA